jgi:hypothetical protein
MDLMACVRVTHEMEFEADEVFRANFGRPLSARWPKCFMSVSNPESPLKNCSSRARPA